MPYLAAEVAGYADEEAIKQEILYGRRLYAKYKLPIIDVSRRSVEETAAMIIQMLYSDHQLKNL